MMAFYHLAPFFFPTQVSGSGGRRPSHMVHLSLIKNSCLLIILRMTQQLNFTKFFYFIFFLFNAGGCSV